MGIYKRKDSPFFWMLCERPGEKPLVVSTKVPVAAYSTAARNAQKRAAEDVYRAKMTDLARARAGLPLDDPTTITFAAYAEWYRLHHLARRRGAVRDGYALARLRAAFDAFDLTAITRPAVQEYISARLAAGVTANTINREVDVLKGMLRDAVPAHLAASPLAGMKKLRIVTPKKRIVNADEEARLLDALKNPVDRTFYIVAVDTLIRLSNVINLKWSEVTRTHLDLEDSKTGPYQVPLSARARAALAALPRAGVYCFPHRRTAKNERDTRNAIGRLLQRACKRAKIPYGRNVGGVTFHTATRATGATRMLRAGVDPSTVQAVGHWKDFRTMQGYLHPDSRYLRDAVNAIAPPRTTSRLRDTAKAKSRQ